MLTQLDLVIFSYKSYYAMVMISLPQLVRLICLCLKGTYTPIMAILSNRLHLRTTSALGGSRQLPEEGVTFLINHYQINKWTKYWILLVKKIWQYFLKWRSRCLYEFWSLFALYLLSPSPYSSFKSIPSRTNRAFLQIHGVEKTLRTIIWNCLKCRVKS